MLLELNEFMPFFQTLLGGLMTLLGVLIVQRKSDNREREKLYRETVQEAFELLRRTETLYVNEAILFHKGIRDSNLDKLRSSEYGDQASEASDKVLALLELYFPFMDELVDEFCETEAELVNFHSHVIDSFSVMDLETYNQESERLSDNMAEKVSQIQTVLSELMRQKTNF